MHSLFEMFEIIDCYFAYLRNKDFRFSVDGYPIFEKDMFLTEYPDMVIPVNQRKNHRVKEPKKTVICFFCGDKFIYPRYEKIFDEIEMYKMYMGVVEPDLTVTADMDIEWQNAVMLLNQLFMAILAANGIKVVLNTRMGVPQTKDMFGNIPKKIMVASGFLGGCPHKQPRDFTYVAKILRLFPEKVVIYGSCGREVQDRIEQLGISYRIYPSFRTLCKEVS